MGKASRKKKERKLNQNAKQQTEKKKHGCKKIKTKTPKTPKKAKKAAQEKTTVLNIAASSMEKGKSSKLISEYGKVLKDFALKQKTEFLDGLDREKLNNFKKETRYICKRGAFYLIAVISLVAVVISIEVHSHNRVYANTKAGSVELGYQTYEQAQENLQSNIKKYFEQPQTYILNKEIREITFEDLGIRVNIGQTMSQLPIINFEKTNPADLFASLFHENNIIPNYTIDGDKIQKTLEEKFNLSETRAKNASLYFEGGNFQIRPEQPGKVIDRTKLIGDIRNNIENLKQTPIKLSLMDEQPRISTGSLQEQKDHLIGLLDNPITLFYEDQSYQINLIDHLDAVNFEEAAEMDFQQDGGKIPLVIEGSAGKLAQSGPVKINSVIKIKINMDKILPELEENLINSIEIPTSPANIYTDEGGNVIIEGKGEDGRSIPRKKLITAIEMAVNGGISSIQVPVHIEKAPLTISDDLKELGIKDLLATGHSAYYGSPANRMFNIDFGTAKFNGQIIASGEEFSFNDTLGPVDASSGFKPEKVIKKDKLEYEIGGGICQVSTTFYRAVLQAGMPVTERNPHSWKVSYYAQSMGHGLDATIYPGVSDLKFINDTPDHILIQSYTEGAEAYFKIYGTDDGRHVILDGPYGGGLTYRWNRIISKDGEEKTEEIWSKYRPIPPPEPVKPAEPAAQTQPEATPQTEGQTNFNF